jgi:hypothetical protein
LSVDIQHEYDIRNKLRMQVKIIFLNERES